MRRTPTSRHAGRRGGFTLVELLVAAALSLVVMTVLALAFQTGMQTLSQLKSVVGMAEQLRAAETVMKRDLFAYHLEADQARPLRVSDGDLLAKRKGYLSFIQGGVVQPSPSSSAVVGIGPQAEKTGTMSATDPDNPQSYRTPSPLDNTPTYGRAWMDHISFTVRLAGDKPQEAFTASAVGAGGLLAKLRNIDTQNNTVPPTALLPELQSADPTGTQLASRWAEVTYFLVRSGPAGATLTTVKSSDEGGVTALPLYTLHRRQRVLADRTIHSLPGPNAFGQADAEQSRGLAMVPISGNWVVLGPDGVATGVENRLGGANDLLGLTGPSAVSTAPATMQPDLLRRGYPIPPTFNSQPVQEYGSDVLLNNVVSMTIRPVYEFDVKPEVLSQLQSLISGGVIPIPLPKSMALPTYNPIDWLELLPVPAGVGRAPLSGAAATPQFPRFYDTAGPSNVGVVFRRADNNAPLSVTWKQNPLPGEEDLSVKLKAIEVKLRVFDSRNKTSRQITILQDL